MINYSVTPRKNPLTKEVKYYAQAIPAAPLTLNEIAERIEKRSTLSSADIKGAFDALQFELIQALQEGHSVRLGDLGSFHITLQSKGAATEGEFSADQIKNVAIHWRRPTKMQEEFRTTNSKIKFKKV